MTTHKLPSLDEIAQEVGIIAFTRWKTQAHREWEASPYFWKGAEAKHAFEYQSIIDKYSAFQEARKASQMASREVLGQERLSYDGRDD